MPTTKLAVCLLFLALCANTLFAERDRGPGHDRPSHARPCVLLYSEPGFQGDVLELDPGMEIVDLRDVRFPDGSRINDRVSSIRIVGGLTLSVYSDPACRGAELRVVEDLPNLRQLPTSRGGEASWDERISAVRVGRTHAGWIPPARDREPDPRERHLPRPHGRPGRPPALIVLYSEANFQGSALELSPGTEIRDLRDIRFPDGSKTNDRVSSIRVVGDLAVTVFTDPKCRGAQVLLDRDVADLQQLQRNSAGSGTWTDCISALRVSHEAPRGGR